MSSEFWGMTAFFISTLFFYGISLFLSARLSQTRRERDELKQQMKDKERKVES